MTDTRSTTLLKYGVWRLRGIDEREDATYLPLRNKGVNLLFHESSTGSGWHHSPIKERCSLDELMACDVIDVADTEICEVINKIPYRAKIVVRVLASSSLPQYDQNIRDRVSAFMLNWPMPIPAYFPLHKIYNIPLAIDTNRFKPNPDFQKSNPHLFLVLYCGQMIYNKGFGELINAFTKASLMEPKIKLILVGPDPAQAAAHYQRINEDKIRYQGWTRNWENIDPFYHEADVFCQPIISGQGSYSMLEALSSGLPLLALDGGEYGVERDYIENGKNGFICKDWNELGDKMIELYNNPKLCKDMGQCSRQRAIKKFSSEAVSNQIIRMLKNIGCEI